MSSSSSSITAPLVSRRDAFLHPQYMEACFAFVARACTSLANKNCILEKD